jgi:hypothetical protein
VKVFDALEAANVRRLLYVGAIDVRDKTQPPPKHYTPESGESTSVNETSLPTGCTPRKMMVWKLTTAVEQSDRMWKAIPACACSRLSPSLHHSEVRGVEGLRSVLSEIDMQAKYDSEVELHTRKTLQYTVLRPGGLTLEPAGGVELGITQVGKTR